jgi:hypothetical protein
MLFNLILSYGNKLFKSTYIFWPSSDGNKLGEGLFPSDIRRPVLGVKLIEWAVKGFIEGMAMKRVVEVVELMHLLPQLRDPQNEFLLHRSSTGISKLFFGLRTCQLIHMEEVAMLFDKELRGVVEDIVIGEGPYSWGLQWRVASLPIRVGGELSARNRMFFGR